jgi:hypothetical protein
MNEDLLKNVAVQTERRFSVLETKMGIVNGDIEEIKEMVTILVANMNKNKGFWAGAVAAGTALGAAISYLLTHALGLKIGGG